MTPGLEFRVASTLQGDGSELAVRLIFNSLEDLEPGTARPAGRTLEEIVRHGEKLRNLLIKVERSDALEILLERILTSTEDMKTLSEQLHKGSSQHGSRISGLSRVQSSRSRRNRVWVAPMRDSIPERSVHLRVLRRSPKPTRRPGCHGGSSRRIGFLRQQSGEPRKTARSTRRNPRRSDSLEQIVSATAETERSNARRPRKTLVDQVIGRTRQIRQKRHHERSASRSRQSMRNSSAQLCLIMHQPDFQKLEGTQRGLNYLVWN